MAFEVELDNYQGPFDVLLDLLRKRQLEITDVAISSITNDYLNYISEASLNLDEVSDFLSIATKLALDKSSAVLFIAPESDEPDIEQSLKRYAQIKSLAEQLRELLKKPFLSADKKYAVAIPTKPIEVSLLNSLYGDLLSSYNDRPSQRIIRTHKKQLEKIRQTFIRELSQLSRLNSDDIVSPGDKTETIVKLLTILDLLKQGRLIRVDNHYQLRGALL